MESRNEYRRPDKKPFEEVKSEEERVYKFKVSLHNGTSICVTFCDPNAYLSLEELVHGLKLEYLRSRSVMAESSQNPKQDESGSIAETFEDESGAIAETFKNTWDWDLTPATEILTELSTHYAFQTALATDLMIEESDCHYLLVHPKAKTMLLVVIEHSGTNEYKGERNYSNLMPVGRSENRKFELFRLQASVRSMLMQPKVLRHRPSRRLSSNSNERLPFLFSYRSRMRSYELYYRGRERERSTISVDLPRSLRRSNIVAHNSHTGWILFMKRNTLMFYSVLGHNLVQVPGDAPIGFNYSVKGCFSGDPAGESYFILLVLHSTIVDDQIIFLRFSRATMIWSFEGRPTHSQYDPISHIQVVGNFVWVDAGSHQLHVIYQWADINALGQLNHIVTPLPEAYPAMPISALIHGRTAVLIGSVAATNALDVRRLSFVNDGLVEFLAWEDFRGQNIYAVSTATGFSIRPQSNGHDMGGNILFLAGNPPTAHCTRISNLQDLIRVDEHQCSNAYIVDELPTCDCLHLWFQVEP